MGYGKLVWRGGDSDVLRLWPMSRERGPATARCQRGPRDDPTEGADKAVRRLFEDRATEGALLNGIGTGGAGWLRVAQELRPVSDGAASEGLDIAIQDALPNPVGVLTLVRQGGVLCNVRLR